MARKRRSPKAEKERSRVGENVFRFDRQRNITDRKSFDRVYLKYMKGENPTIKGEKFRDSVWDWFQRRHGLAPKKERLEGAGKATITKAETKPKKERFVLEYNAQQGKTKERIKHSWGYQVQVRDAKGHFTRGWEK